MKISKKLFYLLTSLFLVTGCSIQNTDLTCSKTFGENDQHVFKYSFKDEKAYLLDWTITIPAKDIADASAYENEFNKINTINGCKGRFTINDNGSYTTHQVCNLSEMSDSDIKDVFMNDRDGLEISRKEIIKSYQHDEGMKCAK